MLESWSVRAAGVLFQSEIGHGLLSGVVVRILLIAPATQKVEPVCRCGLGFEGGQVICGRIVGVEPGWLDWVPETAFVGDVDECCVVDMASACLLARGVSGRREA